MNYLKQFIISFRGLSIGTHHFKFDIDDRFFENYEYSEIKKGKIAVDLLLEKQQRMLILKFTIKGYVNVMCDRCLEYFNQQISGKERLIVKFGEKKYEETDEILIIPETEQRIDISHYIYEYINLLVPYRHVHPEDENGISQCNPEAIKRIEELSKHKTLDHRWDVLKKLKFKS